MRILWCGNYSSQSGYANQSRLFVPRLAAAGHTVTVFELGGGSSVPHMVENIQIVPTHLDPLGHDLIAQHAERLRADAVLTLVDAWGLRGQVMKDVGWFPLAPVDHLPLPPAVAESLKACQRPIAYSRFGVEQMRAAGFDPLFVPHAVDPSVWYPRDKLLARQALNIAPRAFFAAFVGVNDSVPSRKGIPELLMAWSAFSQQHGDVGLYLHTSEQGNLPVSNVGGVRVDTLIETLMIDPATIKWVDQYRYKTGIPASELALIAAAADVLVLPSRGEGFGLPLVEFQRVGTPVMTTDFAAGAELCASGWLIDGEPEWSWQSAFQMKPSVASILDRLEEAYERRGDPSLRDGAIEMARQYDVDSVVAKYLLPVIRSIGEMLLDSVQIA